MVVLVVGVLFLGREAVSSTSSGVVPTPTGTDRVAYKDHNQISYDLVDTTLEFPAGGSLPKMLNRPRPSMNSR
jgi:hypothetical protein